MKRLQDDGIRLIDPIHNTCHIVLKKRTIKRVIIDRFPKSSEHADH